MEPTDLIGRSPAFADLLDQIAAVASFDTRVALFGPTGTGKTRVAWWLHRCSTRAGRPFVKVPCPAVPDTLFVRELFGSERGAYTGSDQAFEGRVAQADGGTLFLEEVADLSAENQAKLLTFLDDGAYRRLGGSTDRRADVRVICATQRPLAEVPGFRGDLAQRLAVFPIRVPALCERGDDVLLLAHAVIQRFCDRHRCRAPTLTDEAVAALLAHPWPGNVRELENVVERGLVRAAHAGARTLDASHLLGAVHTLPQRGFRERMLAFGRHLLEDALRRVDGNRTEAARELGISRSSLYDQLARHGVEPG